MCSLSIAIRVNFVFSRVRKRGGGEVKKSSKKFNKHFLHRKRLVHITVVHSPINKHHNKLSIQPRHFNKAPDKGIIFIFQLIAHAAVAPHRQHRHHRRHQPTSRPPSEHDKRAATQDGTGLTLSRENEKAE